MNEFLRIEKCWAKGTKVTFRGINCLRKRQRKNAKFILLPDFPSNIS